MVAKAAWAAESTGEREEGHRAGLERCGARSGSASSKGSVSAKEARKQGMARRRRSGREIPPREAGRRTWASVPESLFYKVLRCAEGIHAARLPGR